MLGRGLGSLYVVPASACITRVRHKLRVLGLGFAPVTGAARGAQKGVLHPIDRSVLITQHKNPLNFFDTWIWTR